MGNQGKHATKYSVCMEIQSLKISQCSLWGSSLSQSHQNSYKPTVCLQYGPLFTMDMQLSFWYQLVFNWVFIDKWMENKKLKAQYVSHTTAIV